MKNISRNFLYLLLFAIIFVLISVFAYGLSYAASVNISAEVATSTCGNGVINSGEQCDGSNLAGQTCVSLGFSGGSLSCNLNCAINTSQCTSVPPGGGGGGGGGYFAPPETKVVFSGRAYPGMKVTVLKDAQIAAQAPADSAANFRVAVSGLSAGSYIFGVYSEDSQGRRSSLLTFPVTVTSGVTIEIGNIFIAPTIAVDKSEVKRGDNIAIFGQSVPNSEITIAVNSDEEFFNKTPADKNGVYLYNFDTSPLAMEQHFTKSKSALNGEISSFSKAISFFVGTKNILTQSGLCGKADLNCDGRVNLVDFSIAAYWYKRPISVDFAIKEKERLNGDGKVDLVDFSIMAFYWTG